MPRPAGDRKKRGSAARVLLRNDQGGDCKPGQPAGVYSEDVAAANPRPVEGMPWSMTEDDDIDGLAAEYVLGSLDPIEREQVDIRRRSDAALSQAVKDW